MTSKRCPKCDKEMEEVVGFDGYVWCRDCHITKKVQEEQTDDDRSSKYREQKEEVTTKICDMIEE